MPRAVGAIQARTPGDEPGPPSLERLPHLEPLVFGEDAPELTHLRKPDGDCRLGETSG